jgi:hypothetical protein
MDVRRFFIEKRFTDLCERMAMKSGGFFKHERFVFNSEHSANVGFDRALSVHVSVHSDISPDSAMLLRRMTGGNCKCVRRWTNLNDVCLERPSIDDISAD